MTDKFVPTRIVVTAHPKLPDALKEAGAISEYLKGKGIDAPHGSLNDEDLRKQVKQGKFDMLVSVGGDGTMLRAAHLCAPCGVPILGINHGRLGFLFQTESQNWQGMIDILLKGEAWIEHRMMLRAEHLRGGETISMWYALNDAVVSRGQFVRPVHLSASVDGLKLASYVADGLIASTPTGSTAYALAAGGPILPPELRNILLIPIAPHLSVDRAVVLSEGSWVRISILSENTVMSVDGQTPIGLAEDDNVDIRAGEYTAKFVRFGDAGYFYRNLTTHMNQNPTIGLRR
jgi:NAD+ kinase